MSWIYDLAHKIIENTQHKDEIILQTGYGPSGLPHLGTYAEVARTNMLKKAIQNIINKPVKIIVFSDDQDSLRKVPDNVPQKDMLSEYIGVSINKIPDPWNEFSSFAEHNNQELMRFLDMYNFEYTFIRSSDFYGIFDTNTDNIINKILINIDNIKNIVTKDYRKERKETYCPLIPYNQNNEHIFNIQNFNYVSSSYYGLFEYTRKNNKNYCYTQNISNKNFKFQWKVDWPFRWMALGVDFEMHGKDLSNSAKVGKEICNLLGYNEPILFEYELFLDKEGKKISKSVGNGLSFDDWIKYSPSISLNWFLSQNPRKARKIYLDMVPSTVDTYLRELNLNQDKYENSNAFLIHGYNKPEPSPITYNMLINLVNITNTNDFYILWKYIQNYVPNLEPKNNPLLVDMTYGAINFYKDFVEPFKKYKEPSEEERELMLVLASRIELFFNSNNHLYGDDLANALMENVIYEVGKQYFGKNNTLLRENYFKMLYKVLMGQESGPRFGQFVVIYGIENTVELLRSI